MKVSQLIVILQKMPQDKEVLLNINVGDEENEDACKELRGAECLEAKMGAHDDEESVESVNGIVCINGWY
tara:strand:- start:20573 stop:20782 length:210 start_codon:yes stop_codon:yes gene_type:complete